MCDYVGSGLPKMIACSCDVHNTLWALVEVGKITNSLIQIKDQIIADDLSDSSNNHRSTETPDSDDALTVNVMTKGQAGL